MMLRPAVPADAEELTRLHLEVWEAGYAALLPEQVFVERRTGRAERIERWRRIVVESPATTTVADDGDRLLGFVSVGPSRDKDLADLPELWALYVDADAWRGGIGTALLSHCLPAGPALLWVLDGNERAIRFYRRHGFEFDGAIQQDDGMTEHRMVRSH